MYYYKRLTKADLPARTLILSLMSAAGARPQQITHLIRAGELFDIEPSTLRVAVTRMQKDDLIESVSRGVYGPGAKAKPLISKLQSWKEAPARTTKWNGDWLVAMTGHLGRTDRKQVRARTRALGLNGYQETDMSFWVRPANLRRELADHRADLLAIGADEDLIVSRVSAVAMATPQDWASLWSVDSLNSSYKRALRALEASSKLLPQLSAPDAAVESLLVGQSVTQTINYDPLLPAELCSADLFKKLVSEMTAYHKQGVTLWREFQVSSEKMDV